METASPSALRILFVDDDPNLLATLRQKLHSMKGEWAVTFARTGEEALALLRDSRQDVIVSDRQIPEVDDPANQPSTKKDWPSMVRIVLSGQTDETSTLRAVGSAGHPDECDPARLRSVVQRAVALQRLIHDERVRVVVARMDTLPSAPLLLRELMAELGKPDCSLVRAGEIVSQDLAMTAKILRLVNSAYFGFRSKISDPVLAVRFLGINMVSSLVMASHIFQHADARLAAWLGLDRIWAHSITTSRWARKIAEHETQDRDIIDDAFAAGMLHDAGRLVLAVNFPDTYKGLVELAGPAREELLDLERSMIGVTHAEVGAYLMGMWGLRNTIVEAIAYHHTPRDCVHRGFAPLTAVHAACMMQKDPPSQSDPIAYGKLDREYLERNGFQDRVDVWRSIWKKALEAQSAALD